jgi:hypothetical protein
LGTVCCHQSVPQNTSRTSASMARRRAASLRSARRPPGTCRTCRCPPRTSASRTLFQHQRQSKGKRRATSRPKPSVVIRRSEHPRQPPQRCPVHFWSASSIACRSGSMRSCRMRETRMPPGSRRKKTTCLPCSMRRKPTRTWSQGRPDAGLSASLWQQASSSSM